jgi:hypothetical protein
MPAPVDPFPSYRSQAENPGRNQLHEPAISLHPHTLDPLWQPLCCLFPGALAKLRNGGLLEPLVLSGAQLNLILELLESKRKELLVEVRHTDNTSFRAGLKERLRMVEELIRQVEPQCAKTTS